MVLRGRKTIYSNSFMFRALVFSAAIFNKTSTDYMTRDRKDAYCNDELPVRKCGSFKERNRELHEHSMCNDTYYDG